MGCLVFIARSVCMLWSVYQITCMHIYNSFLKALYFEFHAACVRVCKRFESSYLNEEMNRSINSHSDIFVVRSLASHYLHEYAHIKNLVQLAIRGQPTGRGGVQSTAATELPKHIFRIYHEVLPFGSAFFNFSFCASNLNHATVHTCL